MNPKIVLKKKVLTPIDLEGQEEKDCVLIDPSIVPVANGPFSAKMRGGLSISVVKSCYQKSIRRQYLHLSNVCALLWFEVGVIYPPLMSNLINRLIVIAGEDCAANLPFLHWIDQKVGLLRQKKKNSTLNEMDVCLVTSVMNQVPKTRISSWLKSVFYDGLNHPIICDQVEHVYPGILDLKNNYDQLDMFQAYLNALSSKHPLLSIRYALKIHFNFLEKKNSVKKGGQGPNLIWTHLLKMKNDEHMQLFYRWYTKEKNENRIYLVLAHVYLIQPQSFQMDPIDESQMTLYVNEWKNLIQIGKVKIPAWMIDMHTQEGKKKGMNSVNFAVVGAHIENIWMPLYNSNWLDIYSQLKDVVVPQSKTVDMIVHESKNVDVIEKLTLKKRLPVTKSVLLKKVIVDTHPPILPFFEKGIKCLNNELLTIIKGPQVPRGQLITASYKPYVYLPREDPKWVYKGPFASKRLPRLIVLEKRYQAFKMLGSQVIDLELMKDPENSYWIRYENLATVPPEKWQTQTKYDKINQIDVHIIQRDSLGFSQLSKLPPIQIEKILFDDPNPFYLTFLDATLLGCGDLGEHNTLVRNFLANHLSDGKNSCNKKDDDNGNDHTSIYLIDYDDSTTKTCFQTYYDVYARQCSSQKKLFDNRVPGLKHQILERLSLYKQKQSQLENCLGFSLSQIILEMEVVYYNLFKKNIND